MVKRIVAKAPIPAASVGGANPRKIVPRTATIRTTGGINAPNSFKILVFKGIPAPAVEIGGPNRGFIFVTTAI